MKRLGVGICGLGTVGSGTFNLLRDHAAEISRKTGIAFEIAQVGCRRDHPDCDLAGIDVTRDIFDVPSNPAVDVVVELIGGTDVAFDLLARAIENGKHVVTANKALIAERGDELFGLAEEAGVSIRYEAAIAGGIPVVKAIREGLAGNRVDFVAGIINGTSNFILTEMEQAGNRGFAEVLEEAQTLGYAEADPTFDIEGVDAAHKLTILASIAFGAPLRFEAMYTEGVGGVTPADIRYAGELGYCIKHLGVTRRRGDGIELRVHPTLIDRESMLGQVKGVMNAVLVGSEPVGRTMYYGAGAGAGPTASAVVADIIDVARAPMGVANLGYTIEGLEALPVLSIEETVCCFYMKLRVLDKPGVMARISTILSQHEISIESLIQKDAREGHAPIVIVTDEVKESEFDAAVRELQSLPEVEGQVTRIRVESF
ncbi:MAG: homoserine dehydrogenase [Gammaproteobacteria bacterium]|nr:homoserine dehydrogenase [Gammaproteobacteria bacterium]